MANRNQKNNNGSLKHRRQEVQQAVKNACDQLNGDGVAPRDYVEQLAWLFFLKAFDETETRHGEEAAFDDTPYTRRLDGEFRWSNWSGRVNRPDEMLEFVDGRLWRHLQNFGQTPETMAFANDPVAERFRRIFSSVRNHSRKGASFARVVQQVNRMHFSDETDVIVLSEIYEDLLKRVAGDSAGYAGEFYTQRHIIRAMVEVVHPTLGNRVYDPCFGTAGFLAESAEYMRQHAGTLSTGDLETLSQRTFYGFELKPLTYLLGIMNMLLHRIEGANLELGNTLEMHSTNVAERNKYDVILSNPPYGGKLTREIQTNFTIRSGATEILFLQHIMANLRKGGRAAVVIPEGVLFRVGPDARMRERLLNEFNVHTVLSLPAGCFLPYTPVKTNVLFFDRREDGCGTQSVWFYELTNDGFNLKQTRRPIDGSQLPDFLSKWKERTTSANSWVVPAEKIAESGYDLSARNPSRANEQHHHKPADLIGALNDSYCRLGEILPNAERLANDSVPHRGAERVSLGDVCSIESTLVDPHDSEYKALVHVGGANIQSGSGELTSLQTAQEEGVKSGKFLFTPEDVLYNKIRPYLRKVARPDFSGLCSADMYPLRPETKIIDKSFLFYVLLSEEFTDYAIRVSNRAGMPKVNRKDLFAFRFMLPSMTVQRRIARHLDEATGWAQSIAEETRRLEENARQLSHSFLHSVLVEDGDSVDEQHRSTGR